MNRNRALQSVLAVTGVIFVALTYPALIFIRQEPALAMMLIVYATLGVFLLLSIRKPAANRSLIAFTAWSSLVHAVFMGAQAVMNMVAHSEAIGSLVLAVIGLALVALAPPAVSAQTSEVQRA